jgi:2-octaprenyl-6-methoxyphenol hydroxylase
VRSRTAATDLLNLSLTSSFPALHAARGLSLAALSAIGPLRRLVMREGVAPRWVG